MEGLTVVLGCGQLIFIEENFSASYCTLEKLFLLQRVATCKFFFQASLSQLLKLRINREDLS